MIMSAGKGFRKAVEDNNPLQVVGAVNAYSAIMAEKVSENHKMIKPLWEDFIRRSLPNDNVAKLDVTTNSEIRWK